MVKNAIGQIILMWTVSASVAITGLEYTPQADILSADGRDPLEYAVGSDVTVHCHLRNESLDARKVGMYLEKGGVPLVTAVVNASVVSATMRSEKSLLDVMVCMEGQEKVLTSRNLCIGSVPQDSSSSSCYWHLLTEKLSCCTTDGPIQFCNVYSTMEKSVMGQRWELFKERSIKPCGEFHVPNKESTREYSIRIFFSSPIGNSSTNFSIHPLQYAIPLPVEKLNVTEGLNGARVVRWENHWKIRDDVCDNMSLSYSIIAQPLKSATTGLKPYSQVVVANCSQIPHDYPMQHSIPSLDPYTTYNITITPFSKKNVTGEAKSFISVGNTSRVTTAEMTFTYVIAAVIGCTVAVMLSALGAWYCKRQLKKKCLKFAISLELDMADSEDWSSDRFLHEQQAGVTLAKDSITPVSSVDSAFVDLHDHCLFTKATVGQVLDDENDGERANLMVKPFGVDDYVHSQSQKRVVGEEEERQEGKEAFVKYIQREVTEKDSSSPAADTLLCRDERVYDNRKDNSEEEDSRNDNSEEKDRRKDKSEEDKSRKDNFEEQVIGKDNTEEDRRKGNYEEKDSRKYNSEEEDTRKDNSEENCRKDNSKEADSPKDNAEVEDSETLVNCREPKAAMDIRHHHDHVTAHSNVRHHHGYVTTQLLCQDKDLRNGTALLPRNSNGYVRRVD